MSGPEAEGWAAVRAYVLVKLDDDVSDGIDAELVLLRVHAALSPSPPQKCLALAVQRRVVADLQHRHLREGQAAGIPHRRNFRVRDTHVLKRDARHHEGQPDALALDALVQIIEAQPLGAGLRRRAVHGARQALHCASTKHAHVLVTTACALALGAAAVSKRTPGGIYNHTSNEKPQPRQGKPTEDSTPWPASCHAAHADSVSSRASLHGRRPTAQSSQISFSACRNQTSASARMRRVVALGFRSNPSREASPLA